MSTSTMFDLTGKVAVVTGAASGLGRAAAEALAQAGANVVLGDLSQNQAEAAANSINALDAGRAVAVHCDVSDERSVAGLIAETGNRFGPVDILINCAGITDPDLVPLHQQSTQKFSKVMNVNLMGVFFGCREALKVMVPRGSGRIINIASAWGLTGASSIAPAPAYNTSKGAVVNLTRELGLEYATQGITVNAICPGFFRTNIGGGMYEDADTLAAFTAATPMKRIAEVDEIKGLVVYLASDSSSFMTGALISIDGGFIAQ